MDGLKKRVGGCSSPLFANKTIRKKLPANMVMTCGFFVPQKRSFWLPFPHFSGFLSFFVPSFSFHGWCSASWLFLSTGLKPLLSAALPAGPGRPGEALGCLGRPGEHTTVFCSYSRIFGSQIYLIDPLSNFFFDPLSNSLLLSLPSALFPRTQTEK